MIAVDTNILARFYCDDPDDPEATTQRPLARETVLASAALFVPRTVILELEWVMRGFYGLDREDVCRTIDHLLGMPHVTVEDWGMVKDAADLHRSGLDFADALHWAACSACDAMTTFDDRRFRRRAKRLGLNPPVLKPK